jgi:hypothetical protein
MASTVWCTVEVSFLWEISKMLDKNIGSRYSFPYSVSKLTDLPDTLLNVARTTFNEDQVCDGIFVVPVQSFQRGPKSLTKTQQAILFIGDDIYQFIEPSKKEAAGQTNHISTKEIVFIKLSIYLLYGKLELIGIQNSISKKIIVEYNTVAHRLLTPHLDKFIQSIWKWNKNDQRNHKQDETFADFINISYNFYQGMMDEGLKIGEFITGYLYQKELFEPFLKIFRKKIFPMTLMSLTNHQLVFLQEDLEYRVHHEWIFTYIPLHRILGMDAINDEKNGNVRVIYQLDSGPINTNIELLLTGKNWDDWRNTWDNFFYFKKKGLRS